MTKHDSKGCDIVSSYYLILKPTLMNKTGCSCFVAVRITVCLSYLPLQLCIRGTIFHGR